MVTADDRYIRDCILHARHASVVAGYPPVMPSFRRARSARRISSRSSPTSSPWRRRSRHERDDDREPGIRRAHYLTDGFTLRSWLLTTDHKRIALLYLGSITVFFFIGGAAAALIRYNLIVPEGMIASAKPTTGSSPCTAW